MDMVGLSFAETPLIYSCLWTLMADAHVDAVLLLVPVPPPKKLLSRFFNAEEISAYKKTQERNLRNAGQRVNVVSQRLGYLVRCGDPDALDSVVPMAFGNLALDLILSNQSGRLVSVRKGVFDSVPIDVIAEHKKLVDVEKYYNAGRLRPKYRKFEGLPLFIMTGDV